MVSKVQSDQVFRSAALSGEWDYTQEIGKVDYAKRAGDCTDYCRNAVQEGLGDAWAGGPKANTAAFKLSEAAGFTEVEPDAARVGDVVVQGGHAGVFIGRARNGDVWGLANNGRPGKDSSTGPRRFNEGTYGLGTPRFFRPLRKEDE
jgi:hypothetical protein